MFGGRNMTKKMFCFVVATAAVLAFSFFTCKTTDASAKPTENSKGGFSIGKLEWVIDQVEPTFWAKPLKISNKMFISFSLEYKGKFDLGVVESLIIDSPNDYYIIEGEDIQKVIEVDKETINCKRLPCGKGEGRVGLGEWVITITLKNGEKIVKTPIINGFQNMEIDKKASTKYIVPQAKFKNEISALAIPKIKSVSRDEDSIEVFFSISDSRVKNGYFWFDVPGEKHYRDAGSMVDGKGNPVNGCRKFSIDGSMCRYILRRDADNAEWFDKATACCFVVSEVNRVVDPWNERIRSISSLVKIE